MKNVLLLGDSIRMSYQSRVQDLLKGKAKVSFPDDNCAFAKFTLRFINDWMKIVGAPDILHWNNGIWDTTKISERIPVFVELNEYIHTMVQILDEIKANAPTAIIIFATTTPLGKVYQPERNIIISRYNQAISEILSTKGVHINDLYSFVLTDIDHYLAEDDVHLSNKGIAAVGKEVAETIEPYL
jgi:lysophospholipase L1-like esterase